MKVSELMKDVTLDTSFEGGLTHNDMVLAIDVSEGHDAKEDDYAVLQIQIEGTEATLDAETSEKTYIRTGKNTQKTGTQRSFSVSGERYVGDEAQNYIFAHKIKYGTGTDVVVPYIYFNMRTGEGEKGNATVIVNTDGGGDASGGLEIDVELKQYGGEPKAFTYTKTVL